MPPILPLLPVKQVSKKPLVTISAVYNSPLSLRQVGNLCGKRFCFGCKALVCVRAGTEQGEARVKVPGSSPLMETRTISRRALNTVVNARLRELFAIIRARLEDVDLLHRLHAGAVVTGGGAAMKGIDALVQRELGMPVRTGVPCNIDGLSDERHPEAFAAVAGALIYAHRNYEEKSIFQSIFGSLLGRK